MAEKAMAQKASVQRDWRLLQSTAAQLVRVLDRKLTQGLVFAAEQLGLEEFVVQVATSVKPGEGLSFGRFCSGARGLNDDSLVKQLYQESIAFLKLKEEDDLLGLETYSPRALEEWCGYLEAVEELKEMGYPVTLQEGVDAGFLGRYLEEQVNVCSHWSKFLGASEVYAPTFPKLALGAANAGPEVYYTTRGIDEKNLVKALARLKVQAGM